MIENMRYAGFVNRGAIEHGFKAAVPGATLRAVNEAIERFIVENRCRPAFKNYQPLGSEKPFPAAACISPNDVVVHGVPGDYIIKDGDLLTIDTGTEYNGWFVDSARSRVIGTNQKAEYLIEATDAILNAQLSVIKDECTFLELVEVSEKVADQYGITIMSQWGGHRIGERIHIDPFIPSGINRNQSQIKQALERKKYARLCLKEGQTICIEPVTTYGSSDIILDEDSWTVRKSDGLLAAHTERCLLVTKTGYELLS